MSMHLYDLCRLMVESGYEYAHFNRKLDYDEFKAELTVDRKPWSALVFSKLLQPFWVDEDEADNNKRYAPDWYSKLVIDNWRVEEYGAWNLTFAKLAKGGISILRQEQDAELLKLHRRDFTVSGRAMPRFDWPELQRRGYKGIIVSEPESDFEPFGGWDVESLAVWDTSVLTDVKHFKNAGKAYEYVVE